jgi:hypothetical protein
MRDNEYLLAKYLPKNCRPKSPVSSEIDENKFRSENAKKHGEKLSYEVEGGQFFITPRLIDNPNIKIVGQNPDITFYK